jgi:hypothetical protein
MAGILTAINTAAAIASAANQLYGELEPSVQKLIDTGILEKAQGTADGAIKALGDIPSVLINPVKGIVVDPAKQALSEMALKKAIKDTQQGLLEHANSKLKAVDFLQSRMNTKTQELTDFDNLSIPGYFAIATYAKLDLNRDYTDYLGIYLGKSMNLGNGIAKALSREGNPDLYADMKYKQNMTIFMFFSTADTLDEKYQLFSAALKSDRSYNY